LQRKYKVNNYNVDYVALVTYQSMREWKRGREKERKMEWGQIICQKIF